LKPSPVKRVSKTSPKGPIQTIQGKNPRFKARAKRSIPGAKWARWTRHTTDHFWWRIKGRRRRQKKSGEAKAAFLVANRKISTEALHKLSYLLCFLSFFFNLS